MTKDPICGMTVDEATALRAERDGKTFYFCGEHCRKTFLGSAQSEIAASPCCGKVDTSRDVREHSTATRAILQEVIDVLAVLNALRAALPPKVIHDL